MTISMIRIKKKARKGVGGQEGFTLIELLIALALLGLITMIISGSITFGQRAWEVNNRALRAGDMEVVANFLRHRIEQSLAVRDTESQNSRIRFTGNANHLQFVAPVSGRATIAGVYDFYLSSVSGQLIMKQTLFRKKGKKYEENALPTYSRALLKNVGPAKFKFFGTFGKGQAPAWHDQWSSRTKLPLIVQVSIPFLGQDRRKWPHMMIALKYAKK